MSPHRRGVRNYREEENQMISAPDYDDESNSNRSQGSREGRTKPHRQLH
jgi:hypothetical protein